METQATAGGAAGSPELFLDAAARIARRLVDTARWEEDGTCTWQIMSPDRENPGSRQAKPAIASGTLYEGTCGIGLFLAELHAATGDADFARTAEGAIRYALKDGEKLPESSFGYHGGRSGIAYAAARVGELLGKPDLARGAEDILRPLVGNERMDYGIDVIGGAAGAIPALLWLAGRIDEELALGMARRLGDNLIATAAHETGGYSWGTIRSSSIRNLCGYAHGAAGVGHGLLELYRATGEGKYLYAAEQAFLYEREFYNAELGNWPDLRHSELGEYQFSGRIDELKERLQKGDPLPRQDLRYMSAWCHGAPGIGLSRLRAYQLMGDPLYLEEAQGAIRATLASLEDPRLNYSLCHGQGGNAETLLVGAEVLGDESLREAAARVALRGYEEYEAQGRPWPCGTLGAVSDPGLLLGEAGIGYFFLRLARPETPSVLFVTPPAERAAARSDEAGYLELERTTVEEHFARSLRLFELLGEDRAALVPERAPGAVPGQADVEAAYEALRAHVEKQADPERRAMLDDAFSVDREKYLLGRTVTDFTEEYLESLARPAEADVRWHDARVTLSQRARLVHCGYDWDAWLEREDAEHGPPEQADVFYLLQAVTNRVGVRRLSPFAALVLQSVSSPATLDEVVDQVEEAVSTGEGGPERGWLEDRVVEQLRQAYRAGFVSAESEVAAAA